MASCTTPNVPGAVPKVQLNVDRTSDGSTSATYSWELYLIIDSKPAVSSSVTFEYGAEINGKTVCSGATGITRNPDWYLLDDGTITISKSSTSKTINISCYLDLTGIRWSGINQYVKEGSSSFTISAMSAFTVSYNANGGSNAPSSQTKQAGSSLTLSSSVPVRTGYTFKGWNTNASGTGTNYAPGSVYSANANLTLYAQWQIMTYQIAYNANGGSGAPTTQTKTYGVALTLSSIIPTRTNYNFLGWATSSTSTTVTYSPGSSYSTNAALSLYAVWELAYTPPKLTNCSVVRCTSTGVASDSGTYFKVYFDWETEKNIVSIVVKYRRADISVWTNQTITASGTSGNVSKVLGSNAISNDYSYIVNIVLTDANGSITVEYIIPSRLYAIDILNGGRGVSVGKTAEVQDRFDSAWVIREQGVDLPSKYVLQSELIDKIYPVGSIYLAYDHTSPASRFGGTWSRISPYFLYAAGETAIIGETGGEAAHTLTVDELPPHRHGSVRRNKSSPDAGTSSEGVSDGDGSTNPVTDYTGGGQPFDIIPPFIKISAWRRTA